jgi:hypothetical protein
VVDVKQTGTEGTMSYWLCLPFGVIAPSLRKNTPPGDERTIQVRARRREILDTLRDRWLPELGENDAHAGTDYQYRAYCTPGDLARAVSRMTLAIDDPSFKALSEGPGGLADKKLARDTHHMYTDMWDLIRRHGDGTSPYDRRGWL